MPAPQLVIVADDLTGAADTGGRFAESGLATAIPLRMERLPQADILVVSTGSRELEELDARQRVRDTVESIVAGGRPRWWYKKVDSALRGHPGAELLELMDTLDIDRGLIAPALPAEGRVTLDGMVMVHGKPLDRSDLASVGGSARIADRFSNRTGRPVVEIGLATVRGDRRALVDRIAQGKEEVLIADAASDSDLAAVAEAAVVSESLVIAGSAGLGRALADLLPIVAVHDPPPTPARNGGPVLVVAGSRHQATARQIAALRAEGALVVHPPQITRLLDSAEVREVVTALEEALNRGRNVVLTTAGMPGSELEGMQIAGQLAAIAADPAIRRLVGGMVLTGGDVAAAVCRAYGSDTLWLHGEVLPAIPSASLGGGYRPGLPVVTKAGSFGAEDALVRSVAFIRGAIVG